MSGTFVRHEPCPNCGSRDNLGVWRDGHKYCFGCGFVYRPDAELSIKGLQENLDKINNKREVVDGTASIASRLPSDLSHAFPPEVKGYFKRYGLTDREIYGNNFRWSNSDKALFFLAYGGNADLIFAQSRNFELPGVKRPKATTYGSTSGILVTFGEPSDVVVLVEDVLSAIKVGRTVRTICLFGSQISNDLVLRIRNFFAPKRVIIWLDADKYGYAIRRAEGLRNLFDDVKVLHTVNDPKDYSDEVIKEHLNVNR